MKILWFSDISRDKETRRTVAPPYVAAECVCGGGQPPRRAALPGMFHGNYQRTDFVVVITAKIGG